MRPPKRYVQWLIIVYFGCFPAITFELKNLTSPPLCALTALEQIHPHTACQRWDVFIVCDWGRWQNSDGVAKVGSDDGGGGGGEDEFLIHFI